MNPTPEQRLATLKERVHAFNEARSWRRYNTAKNMAMALSVETGELLAELCTSRHNEQRDEGQQVIAHELADILFVLLEFATVFAVDVSESLKDYWN